MKPFCFAVATALVIQISGCASSGTASNAPPPPGSSAASSTDAAAKPPRLSIGVRDPDTELILPWFLDDIVNRVNNP
ncbi:hypothetical protein D7S86_15325 [Pararobbsia silviterrae]|uniref:Uncharacterized protein n=1 Tax=Pararobbsia silviterrae TaxID=1792498 RepID=A0A494XXP1_9BURK|nr:hypothetical protein D7S86_15325 [Pararobbsia silviterrae]